MANALKKIAADHRVIDAPGMGTITVLSSLGGLSCCLSTWIIPMLRRSSSSTSAIIQFELMIEKDSQYLQTSSRCLAAALATLTHLTYKSADAKIHSQWRFWATALGILVPLAPYEIIFIFPSNYRISDIGKRLMESKEDELSREEDDELHDLFTKWQWRNGVRFVTPVVASLIGLVGMLHSARGRIKFISMLCKSEY